MIDWIYWSEFLEYTLELQNGGFAYYLLDNGMRILVGIFPFIVVWKVVKFIIGAGYK